MRHQMDPIAFNETVVTVDGADERAADTIAVLLDAGARVTVRGANPCERILDWVAGDYLEFIPTEAVDLPKPGHVTLVGAGPGDAGLLTQRAAGLIATAEVVIHDRLVSREILDLAGPNATMLDVGKKGFGASTPQASIDDLMIEHARRGARVVRLKAGDPGIFGRMDEETAALDAAGIEWSVVPGITAAAAAAADIGVSLTRRGRNQAVTILTGHDVDGYAEHDWKRLAEPGQTAAIYMGLRAATFLRGRLLMFGASAATPVTVVFEASRATREIVETTLLDLPEAIASARSNGAAVILYGLEPHRAEAVLPTLNEVQA